MLQQVFERELVGGGQCEAVCVQRRRVAREKQHFFDPVVIVNSTFSIFANTFTSLPFTLELAHACGICLAQRQITPEYLPRKARSGHSAQLSSRPLGALTVQHAALQRETWERVMLMLQVHTNDAVMRLLAQRQRIQKPTCILVRTLLTVTRIFI